MATRQRAPGRRRILEFLVAVPVAIVGIVVVYALASFADGSLAHVSGPVEVAILAGVMAVLLFSRWLLTRPGSASRKAVLTEGAGSDSDNARATSWPPGKTIPSTTPIAMPTIMPTLPAVPSAWGASAAPTASTAAPTSPTVAPNASTVAPSASTVVRMPTVVGSAPAAIAAREPTIALEGSGPTSALAEYLDGRTELTNLIASVEARIPSEMPGEPEPEAQPDATVVARTEADRSEGAVAENTNALAQAVEQVTRACELIARACELFAERIESDRVERRALADAMMLLAQQAMPVASPPRFVNARASGPSLVVENGSLPADRQATSGDLGVAAHSPS